MSAKSFAVLKMMNIPARFGLSANVAKMLRQLDDYHMGHISEDELGKMVRLSPQMRKSITETISKCAGIMEKKPEEVKYCVAIIQSCTEILTAAGKFLPPRSPTTSFHHITLPHQLRCAGGQKLAFCTVVLSSKPFANILRSLCSSLEIFEGFY